MLTGGGWDLGRVVDVIVQIALVADVVDLLIGCGGYGVVPGALDDRRPEGVRLVCGQPAAGAQHRPLGGVFDQRMPGSGGWLPFVFGCIAGAIPWLVIVLYVVAPESSSDASPPGSVYGIIVSLFVFFNIFAVNQFLQYKHVGRWRDYLYGEYVYVALSPVAKSLLAWQVFAGALAG